MRPLALIVENDDGTRRLLEVLLTRAGFSCDCTGSFADAMQLIRHVEYDAYFFDLMLTGASGMQILEALAATKPDALRRCTIISAASEKQLTFVERAWPHARVVRKPFDLDDVTTIALRAAAGRPPREERDSEEFCRRSLVAGAKTGVIVRRTGTSMAPVVSFGYPEGYLDAFFPLALDQQYPICDSVRNGRAVWLDSTSDAAAVYPNAAPIFAQNHTAAAAIVPLVRNQSVIGAAGWSFREAHHFAEVEQRALTAIAETWSVRLDPAGTVHG